MATYRQRTSGAFGAVLFATAAAAVLFGNGPQRSNGKRNATQESPDGRIGIGPGSPSRPSPARGEGRGGGTRAEPIPAQAQPTVTAARRLNRASAMLAFSVLADAGIEHYRGSFENKAMYAPLAASALALTVSAHGTADARPRAHLVRDAAYGLAMTVGLIGFGFHLYNIGKRPGGFSWLNLFYAAPIAAPGALTLSGILGIYSERVRDSDPGGSPKVLGFPAGRALAVLTALGIVVTIGEVGLLHFRGAYHDPAMFLPVTVPPVAAALLAYAATRPGHQYRRLTQWWLCLTALLGIGGVGFHAFGVHRNMGGWSNWSQNLLNGPPLPAPPSFTGLALAGLAALGLMEEHADA